MDIDLQAPVVSTAERDLDVPASTAWKVLSDIEQWDTWVPDMKGSTMEGALLPGAGIRWRAKGMQIKATLRVVEKPGRLVWTGRTLGLRAIHSWELEPTSIATCRCVTRESMDGWMTKLARGWVQSMVDKSLASWIESFRKRVRSEVPCE